MPASRGHPRCCDAPRGVSAMSEGGGWGEGGVSGGSLMQGVGLMPDPGSLFPSPWLFFAFSVPSSVKWGWFYSMPGRGVVKLNYARSEKHFVTCCLHSLCLLPVAFHTALTYPARPPAAPCSPGHEVPGSLTQLRRAQVPPWTWPLPLGASVSCSMFC